MQETEQPSNRATQQPVNKRAGIRPPWLKIRVPGDLDQLPVAKLMHDLELNTVCQEARCPNIFECWGAGTATFMVLGEICTRRCTFCAVSRGTPIAADADEPRRVAEAIEKMGVRSLQVLAWAHEEGMLTKSSLMLGLGETEEEILAVASDLRDAGVEIFTMGQYLAPTERHHPVRRYYRPEEFAELGEKARELGFQHVESAPLVRSSYMAHRALESGAHAASHVRGSGQSG